MRTTGFVCLWTVFGLIWGHATAHAAEPPPQPTPAEAAPPPEEEVADLPTTTQAEPATTATTATATRDNLPNRVVVFALDAAGINADLARTLSQLLTFSIREALPNSTVHDQTDIDNLLSLAENKQLMGCDGGACLAEIGGALGADHLATGSIGKVGNRHLVDLRLIETAHMKTVRHLSEKLPGEEDRLAEAISQMAAHLVDPAQAIGMGSLSIWGIGAVSVDGTPIGPAPIEEHSIEPGEHVVMWHDNAGGAPTGRVRVTVEPYSIVRVDQPQGAADGMDLGGLYATFGVGNSPYIRVGTRETGRAGAIQSRVGWTFSNGATLHLGRSLQSSQRIKKEGGVELALAADVGTVGFGYQSGGKLRYHLALDLGGGRIFSPEDGFDTERVITVQPSVSLLYSFDRYLQIGTTAFATGMFSEDTDLFSTAILAVAGIPSGGEGHHAQQDFYKSFWFWSVGLTVVAGSVAIGFLSDQVGVLSIGG